MVPLAFAMSLALLGGCAGSGAPRKAATAGEPIVKEAFVTAANPADNLDSPAVWRAHDGSARIYVTAKSTDALRVFDAATGASLPGIGTRGTGAGQFLRPNGISIVGDVMFVVERDGKRVQVFALPDARPLGSFGADVLGKPYGLWVREQGPQRYRVHVTDDWMPAGTAGADGAKKVRIFDLSLEHGFDVKHVADFGDASGAGRLRVVESIYGDPARGHLLVADEYEGDGSRLKLFDLDGRYLGRDPGVGHYQHQAEGFALYACADGTGYWIGSDQAPTGQRYVVFDRASLDYIGALRPAVANTTDGVWLDQHASQRFPAGAFYVSHSDNAIAAFDWRDIAAALKLRSDCAM
jgi:3-phytase